MKTIKYLLGFIIGVFTGYLAVSLYTPKTGDEIRKEINSAIDEMRFQYEMGERERREELELEVQKLRGEC